MALTQSPTANVKVSIGFSEPLPAVYPEHDGGYQPRGILWTDVTSKVLLDSPLQIERGRQGEDEQPEAGTLSLLLDNTDGRFTLGSSFFGTDADGHGLVKIGRPIRVTGRVGPESKNILPRHETITGSLEDSDHNWVDQNLNLGNGFAGPIFRNFTDEVSYTGTYSFRVLNPAHTAGNPATTAGMQTQFLFGNASQTGDVKPSTQYTFSIYVYTKVSGIPLYATLGWVTVNAATGAEWDQPLHERTRGPVVTSVANTWQRLTVTSTSPPNVGYAGMNVFSGYASGAAAPEVLAFFDGSQLEASASATAFVAGSTEQVLFSGFVDQWPISFPGGDNPVVSLSATDSTKRLARRTLRSFFQETVMQGRPEAYFPLDADSSDGVPGNIGINSNASMRVVAGPGATDASKVVFGAAPSPATASYPPVPITSDFGKCVSFEPESHTVGRYLEADVSTMTEGFGFSLMLNVPATPNAAATTIASFLGMEGEPAAHLVLAHTGEIYLQTYRRHPFTQLPAVTDHRYFGILGPYLRGAGWWQVHVTIDPVRIRMVVGGFERDDATLWPQGTRGITKVRLGGDPHKHSTDPTIQNSGYFVGQMSHLAVWGYQTTDRRPGVRRDLTQEVSNGRDGETTFQRAAAIARFVKEPFQINPLSAPKTVLGERRSDRARRLAAITEQGSASSERDRPAGGTSALELLHDVARTEHGVIHYTKMDELELQDRHFSLARPPRFTLDATTGVLQDLSFSADDSRVVNEVYVTRPGEGNAGRSVDVKSQRLYGVSTLTVEERLHSDTPAQATADYILARRAHPSIRIGTITVSGFQFPELAQALLTMDVGTRFRLTNLPKGGPSTLEVVAQKVIWSFGVGDWTVAIETEQAEEGRYWRLGSDQAVVSTANLAATANLFTFTGTRALPVPVEQRYPQGSLHALVDANGRQQLIRVSRRAFSVDPVTGVQGAQIGFAWWRIPRVDTTNIGRPGFTATHNFIDIDIPAASFQLAVGHRIVFGLVGASQEEEDAYGWEMPGQPEAHNTTGFHRRWSQSFVVTAISTPPNGRGSRLTLDRTPYHAVYSPNGAVHSVEVRPAPEMPLVWAGGLPAAMTGPVTLTSPLHLWAPAGEQVVEAATNLAEAKSYNAYSVLGASKSDPNGMRLAY